LGEGHRKEIVNGGKSSSLFGAFLREEKGKPQNITGVLWPPEGKDISTRDSEREV